MIKLIPTLTGLTTGGSGTMFSGTEALIEDAFMILAIILCMTAVVAVLSANMAQSGWLWWIWGLITTAMAGLVVGAFHDARTRFVILTAAIYLIFGWGWLRRLLFGGFWRGVIFAVLLTAAVVLCWLL